MSTTPKPDVLKQSRYGITLVRIMLCYKHVIYKSHYNSFSLHCPLSHNLIVLYTCRHLSFHTNTHARIYIYVSHKHMWLDIPKHNVKDFALVSCFCHDNCLCVYRSPVQTIPIQHLTRSHRMTFDKLFEYYCNTHSSTKTITSIERIEYNSKSYLSNKIILKYIGNL